VNNPSPPKHDTPIHAKTLIGWREFVTLPNWNVPPIRAKADTGARTSAIDVTNIEELENNRVRFEIVADRNNDSSRVIVEADIVRRTRIKSSFGKARDRLIVKTIARIGTIENEIELGLVSRKRMICRMLLGRKALEPLFLVDPARRYMHGRKKRTKRIKPETQD
jgi:hypothetical protein